jgi:hypothetical protein
MLNEQILINMQEYIQIHLNIKGIVISEEHIEMELQYSVQSETFTIDMEDYIKNHRQPTLNQVLFRMIDNSGESDTEIYKKAGIDRKLFSKIRSNLDYRPSKNTTISLALALQLDKKDTDSLLSSAGYSLSDSNTFDLVIQYCLENRIHDIYSVNEALYHFDQKTL